MKKAIALALALTMGLSLVACGSSSSGNSSSSAASTTAASSESSAANESPASSESSAADTAVEDITQGEKLNIKWYAVLPDTHPTITPYAELFDEIAEETNGRITFTMTAGGVLGTEQEGFDMIRDGTVQGGMMNTSYYESYVPNSQGWMMPYTFTDYELALKYFNEVALPDWNEQIESSTNTIAVNAVSPGFRCLTCNTAVYKPEDASGLRIRSMESPMSQSYVSVLGGVPVPLAWAEVYMGLSTGSIAGQENPITHIQTYNLFEVQDYLVFTEHAFILSWSIFNADFWNGLSETDRAYLTEKFTKEAQMSIESVNTYTEDTFGKLESEYGMTVITPENGLDKQAFIDNADKFLNENFTAPEYDGWWDFRNAAVEWCEANS